MYSYNYRARKWLQSRFGAFRTGDRVAVTGGLLGDYTGTVCSSVHSCVTIQPDKGCWAASGHRDIPEGATTQELSHRVTRIT